MSFVTRSTIAALALLAVFFGSTKPVEAQSISITFPGYNEQTNIMFGGPYELPPLGTDWHVAGCWQAPGETTWHPVSTMYARDGSWCATAGVGWTAGTEVMAVLSWWQGGDQYYVSATTYIDNPYN